MADYIPGVCNIGPDEIRSKYALAWLSVVVAVVFLGLSFFIQMPHMYRIVVFFPVFLAFLCFAQATNRFCVNFGLQGLMNMDKKAGIHTDKVQEIEFSVQDRSKARLIILLSFIASIVSTAIVVAL
jgi:hypothetical protein